MNRYEVHTYTMCQGWINCWSVTENGIETADTYETIEECRAEIKDCVETGNAESDGGYDYDDYRVFDRQTNEYVG